MSRFACWWPTTWILALLALVPRPAHAQDFDPNRTLIVFGGFGYFDDTQHRWLTDLIRRDASQRSRYWHEGQELESAVAASSKQLLSTRSDERGRRRPAMDKWSSHDVVFDEQDLRAAFERATGERVVSTRDMFAEFDRAYMVVLSSGFEHQAVLRTAYDTGVKYHAYAAVSVSASLVDLRGSGDILLSSSVLGEHDFNEAPAPDAPDSDAWAGRFATIYAATASQALGLLLAQAQRSSPRDIERSLDSYMVTGAIVQKMPGAARPASELAANTFEWTLADSIGSFCTPVNNCADGSKACAAMRGYLINALSRRLSQAGHRVLPPLTWRAGIRTIDDLARFKLSLPSTALPDLASSTELDFNPKRATYKVVATLAGITLTTERSRSGVHATDAYGAFVNGWVSRTDPVTCSAAADDWSLLDKKFSAFATKTDSRPANEPPIDADSQRLLFMRAIHDATSTLTVPPRGR